MIHHTCLQQLPSISRFLFERMTNVCTAFTSDIYAGLNKHLHRRIKDFIKQSGQTKIHRVYILKPGNTGFLGVLHLPSTMNP